MADTAYQKLVEKWKETTDLPPQTVGPLTPYYKMITKRLKVMPWVWLVAVSVILVIGLYIMFGPSLSGIVSLLQRGF